MPGAARMAMLPDGRRLHLQHGPIDIVAEAFGESAEVDAAYRQAGARFATILDELVAELALLRRPLGGTPPTPEGSVARRMLGACWPHRARFITPMAAVAGSVADEVLAAMTAGRSLARAYVNNGGDIAVHLSPGTSFSAGVVNDPDRPGLDDRIVFGADEGRARHGDLGLARALALVRDRRCGHGAGRERCRGRRCGDADRQCRHRRPSRRRTRAGVFAPRGKRPRRTAHHRRGGAAPRRRQAAALDAGLAEARAMQRAGLIDSARLALQGETRTLAPAEPAGATIAA